MEYATGDYENDEDVSTEDRLYRVSEATNDDGFVDVEIMEWGEIEEEEWDDEGEGLYVVFRTPLLNYHETTMDFPEKDDEEYRFVRLCHAAGLDLNGAKQLEDSEVKADPESWELITPYSDDDDEEEEEEEEEEEGQYIEEWSEIADQHRETASLSLRSAAKAPFSDQAVALVLSGFVVSCIAMLVLGGAELGLLAAGLLSALFVQGIMREFWLGGD